MVTSVMISCEQRQTDRDRTLPQLWLAGLDPHVILSPCNPASQPENGRVSKAALTYALKKAPHKPILFLEDDIELAPDFVVFLRMAIETEEPVYLYVNDKSWSMEHHYGLELVRRIKRREALPRQLVRVNNPTGLYGTQAVVLPPKFARAIRDLMNPPEHALDGYLHRYWLREGVRPLVAVPAPVQHRNSRVAREEDTREKRSATFDLERLEGGSGPEH